MKNNKLFKLINNFFKLAAESEELPENSKDVSTILKNLSSLETFKARVDYAEKNLKHLSSGTSRVVYVLPGEKEVLKLAKNERGVAQNKVESKVKSKYVNETVKSCKNGCWKISPFLDKITEKEFEELCGVNFKDFGESLSYGLKEISKDDKKKPKCFDEVSKTKIYKDLTDCAKKNKLLAGDLKRISSWGVNGDTPVLLDAGLTKEIFDEFYE